MTRRSSFFRYRMERRPSFFYGRFDYHQSRQHISERHEPRFLLKYTALIVIFHAFFLSGFRIFVFRISRRSMLSECQGANLPFIFQRMCRSRRIVCSCPFMVRASTFLLNSIWTFCAFTKTSALLVVFWFFLPVGSFCSRSECEKRKGIWDACAAEIQQDPGQTKDFDTQMLAVMDTMGQ